MKILGIDPGLGRCGFGLIETTTRTGAKALDYGVVTTTVDAPLPSRLKELHDSLTEVFDQTKPDLVAVEKLFFAKNITTGIAVAEARGIVLLVAEQKGIKVYEYTPNEIKKSLTGYGAANKTQMQEMVRVHLGLENKPKPDDAADALAAAITCAFLYQTSSEEKYKFSNSRKKSQFFEAYAIIYIMRVNIRSSMILSLMGFTALSFLVLSSSSALAHSSTVSTASITIDESCTMFGTTNTAHTADLVNGTYSGTNYPNGIGQTTLKVFCNDSNGFAIYAIGYTNDEYGNNKLHWSGATSTSDITNDINTGIYSSGATTSSWSMKLSAVAGTYAATIDDGVSANNNSTDNFTNWHIVPTEYKRVAYRTSGTDLNTNNNGTGSSITTTYDAYVSATQPAGTYVGQVKYTLVHPNKSDQSNKPLNPLTSTDCPAGYVCYAPNSGDIEGSMASISEETITTSDKAGRVNLGTSATTADLIAPNYKRSGYGFAGWSTDFEATSSSTIYGPNETITVDLSASGLALYPVWIAKEPNVTMQTFNSTNYSAYTSAPNGTVIALEDERDHDVYAVAKLADGKWWMIENLRLDNTATLTTTNTHNPLHDTNNIVTLKTDYANNTIATHLAASNSTWCTSGNAACYDQTMLNTNNTRISDSSFTANYYWDGATYKWYSYGNYYNWYSATAGNGTYSFSNQNDSVAGDLCPAGWRLPKGGQITVNTTADYYVLVKTLMNGAEPNHTVGGYNSYTTEDDTDLGTIASETLRTYPNNFLYSGSWYNTNANYRNSFGFYWASSTASNHNASSLFLNFLVVRPGVYNSNKHYGYSVRCVAGSQL